MIKQTFLKPRKEKREVYKKKKIPHSFPFVTSDDKNHESDRRQLSFQPAHVDETTMKS